MAVGRPGWKTELSTGSIEKIVGAEAQIVDILLEDLKDEDSKVRKAAVDALLQLGFQKPAQEAKGIVAFLLQRAREGKFGEYAALVGIGHAPESDVQVVRQATAPPLNTPIILDSPHVPSVERLSTPLSQLSLTPPYGTPKKSIPAAKDAEDEDCY